VVEAGALEGPVWLRRAVAPLLGEPVDNRETYFALRGVVHDVDVSGQTEIEAYEDQPHRWWSVEEIRASDETFVPLGLAEALGQLLDGPWSGAPRIVD
jgi:hypothetical protein